METDATNQFAVASVPVVNHVGITFQIQVATNFVRMHAKHLVALIPNVVADELQDTN